MLEIYLQDLGEELAVVEFKKKVSINLLPTDTLQYVIEAAWEKNVSQSSMTIQHARSIVQMYQLKLDITSTTRHNILSDSVTTKKN